MTNDKARDQMKKDQFNGKCPLCGFKLIRQNVKVKIKRHSILGHWFKVHAWCAEDYPAVMFHDER